MTDKQEKARPEAGRRAPEQSEAATGASDGETGPVDESAPIDLQRVRSLLRTSRRRTGGAPMSETSDPGQTEQPEQRYERSEPRESLLFPDGDTGADRRAAGLPRRRSRPDPVQPPVDRPTVVTRSHYPPPEPPSGHPPAEPSRALPRQTLPPLEERRSLGSWFAQQPEMRWFGGRGRAPEDHHHHGDDRGHDPYANGGYPAHPEEPSDPHGPPRTPGWSFDHIETDSWFGNQPEVQRLVADPDSFQPEMPQYPQGEPVHEPPRPLPRPASQEQRSRPLKLPPHMKRNAPGQIPSAPPAGVQARSAQPAEPRPQSAPPSGGRRPVLSHEEIAAMMEQRHQAEMLKAEQAAMARNPQPAAPAEPQIPRPRMQQAALPPPAAHHAGPQVSAPPAGDPVDAHMLPYENAALASPGSWFAQQPEFQRAQRRYEDDGGWTIPWRPLLLVTLLVAIVGMASIVFPGLFGGRGWIATDATFDIEPSTPRAIGRSTQALDGSSGNTTAEVSAPAPLPTPATRETAPAPVAAQRGLTVLERRPNGGPVDPGKEPGGSLATNLTAPAAPANDAAQSPAFPPLIAPGSDLAPSTAEPATLPAGNASTFGAGQSGADGQSSVLSPSRPPSASELPSAQPEVDPFTQFSSDGANLDPNVAPPPPPADNASIEVIPASFTADDSGGALANARTLFLQRNYAEAGRVLRDTIASDASNEAALDLYGQVLMMERNHTAALEVLDALTTRRPNDARILLNRGTALLALRRSPEAVAVADSALSAAPNALEPLLLRAKASAGVGNMADAMNDCERINQLGGTRSVSEWCRGTVLNQTGEHFGAVRMYISILSAAEPEFVRQKQAYLRDLALYDGPLDGKSSQTLIEAVTACAVARNCIL